MVLRKGFEYVVEVGDNDLSFFSGGCHHPSPFAAGLVRAPGRHPYLRASSAYRCSIDPPLRTALDCRCHTLTHHIGAAPTLSPSLPAAPSPTLARRLQPRYGWLLSSKPLLNTNTNTSPRQMIRARQATPGAPRRPPAPPRPCPAPVDPLAAYSTWTNCGSPTAGAAQRCR